MGVNNIANVMGVFVPVSPFSDISLFFLQSVFEQETFRPARYQITDEAFEHIQDKGIATEKLRELLHVQYPDASRFNDELSKFKELNREDRNYIFASAEINQVIIVDK